MPVAAIVTIAGTLLICVALAIYLTIISAALIHVTNVLDRVLDSINLIARQTEPLRSPINDVVRNVEAIQSAFERLPVPGLRGARMRARA